MGDEMGAVALEMRTMPSHGRGNDSDVGCAIRHLAD